MKQLLLALIALAVGAGMGWAQSVEPAAGPSTTRSTLPQASRAVVIPIHGEINDFTTHILKTRLDQAKLDGADTIILELNTPGGAVSSALDITRLLKKTGESMNTIAYVHEMAYSAGTMIAYACHKVVMEDHSRLGDCAPILMGQGGLENVEGANRAKIESPLVAEFEDSAERNGHDPILARAFVQYQYTVYVIESPSGESKYVAKEALDQYLKQGWKLAADVKNPIDDELTLLTVNETTAKRLGISKGTYESIESFAQRNDLQIVQRYVVSTSESLVGWLSGSAVRGLLGMMFMLSLYIAFTKPGTGLPEAAAVVVGVLLFGVPILTGYAGILEIALITVGVALVAMEIFVTPGFGFMGITGLICLLSGMVLTFVPSEAPGVPGGPSIFPQLPQTQQALQEGLLITVFGMIISFGLWLWLSKYLPRLPYFNRLILNTTVGSTPESDDPARDAVEATWPHLGAKGIAVTDLRPGGTGRFYDTIINDDRNLDVICDHGFVAAGDQISVRRKNGNEIVVRKV